MVGFTVEIRKTAIRTENFQFIFLSL